VRKARLTPQITAKFAFQVRRKQQATKACQQLPAMRGIAEIFGRLLF
jgi:hypothetical protein